MLIEFKKHKPMGNKDNKHHRSYSVQGLDNVVDHDTREQSYEYEGDDRGQRLNVTPMKYKNSPFLDQVIEQDLKVKNEQKDKFQLVKQKRQKQDAYNKFVREMHPTKASPRKYGELLTNIERIKHPVKQKKETYDNYLQ